MDIQGLFGWISNLGGDVSFFIAPIVQQSSGTWFSELVADSVPSLFGAVVGGFFLLCVALKAFRQTQEAEANQRRDVLLAVGAGSAYAGYVKLLQWVNLMANQKEMINDAYTRAEKNGLSTQEPCDVVPAFVGRFVEPDFLKPEEYSFLAKEGKDDLIAELHLLEQRAANTAALMMQYSQLAIEFDRWRESVTMQRAVLEKRLVDAIPSNLQGIAQGKRGNMNEVMEGIRGSLDADLSDGDRIVQKFIDAAHHYFGERFPHMTFGPPKQ